MIFNKDRHTLCDILGYAIFVFVKIAGWTIVANFIVVISCFLLGIDIKYVDFNNVFYTLSSIEKKRLITLLVWSVLVMPFFEEIFFRLPLRKFKKNVVPSFITGIIILSYSLVERSYYLSFVVALYLIVLLFGCLVSSFSHHRGFYVLFYFSIICASFFYVRNVVLFEVVYWPLYLMYLSHLLIKSYFLSKLRCEEGTAYSFSLNALFAVIPFVKLLLD